MKRIALVRALVCGLSLFVMATPASAGILIDFDTAADGSTINNREILTNQYAAWGVTFSAFEGGSLASALVLDDGPIHGNGWVNLPSADYIALDILRMEFASPVEDVRWLMSPLGVVTEFRAYDARGTLLESQDVASYERVSAGFSVSGISRIDGISIDNTFWGIDDLEFSLVPEPSTVVLWALGGAAIWIELRRRQLTAVAASVARGSVSRRRERNTSAMSAVPTSHTVADSDATAKSPSIT
ncbi:MAG: hypothetical protein ACYC3X_13420 [Pirellulaceae bacterium]